MQNQIIPYAQQIIGAIKIKDGLFIGDEFASKDLDFIISNKVTHIINCAGKQIINSFESFGVKYLTLNWMENDSQILFDARDQAINDIYQFIEEAQNQGESCLTHSLRGQSRSCCALAGFFMKKYKWKLYKTLEFLNSRRPDLEIKASFFHQLTALEQKLLKSGQGAYSSSWDPFLEQDLNLEQDERLLRNTFQNAKQSPPAEYWLDRKLFQESLNLKRAQKIRWADEKNGGKLVSVIGGSGRNATPLKKDLQKKPILREEPQGVQINSINGTVIHVTVNNFLTPSQQIAAEQQNQINSYQEPLKDQKITANREPDMTFVNEMINSQMNNNHLAQRGMRRNNNEEKKQLEQKIGSNYAGGRRQQDSLKKHEEKKQMYQSPYGQLGNPSLSNSKTFKQPTNISSKQNQQSYFVKVMNPKEFFEQGGQRPQSANMQERKFLKNFIQSQVQQEMTNKKRPQTGGPNLRQFSPVVKSSKMQPTQKNPLIVTQVGGGKKQTMRYPSPGQPPKEINFNNLIDNSFLYQKPTWK